MSSDQTGCRRWLVLVMTCINVLVNGSMNYHVGVLNLAITDTFQADPKLTSWLMSLYVSLFALGGIGQCMSYVGGSVVLAFYFPAMTSIAMGIYGCGAGLGAFLQPPLTQIIIDTYGLRGAFLIVGAISFHSCVTALFLTPNKLELTRKSTKHSLSERLRVLRVGAFDMFMLANFFQSVAYVSVVVYLPEYLVEATGYSKQQAAVCAAVFGVGGIVSRLAVGISAAEEKIGEMLVFFGLNTVAIAVSLVAPALTPSIGGAYFVSFAFGLYTAGTVVLMNPVAITLLGIDRASLGLGLILMVYGIGAMVGPPISAAIVQAMGHDALFYFASLNFLISAGLCVITSLIMPKSTTNVHKIFDSEREIGQPEEAPSLIQHDEGQLDHSEIPAVRSTNAINVKETDPFPDHLKENDPEQKSLLVNRKRTKSEPSHLANFTLDSKQYHNNILQEQNTFSSNRGAGKTERSSSTKHSTEIKHYKNDNEQKNILLSSERDLTGEINVRKVYSTDSDII